MKRIAYARVSTEHQVLHRQLDALQAYGYDEIFTEKMTGTNTIPQLNHRQYPIPPSYTFDRIIR